MFFTHRKKNFRRVNSRILTGIDTIPAMIDHVVKMNTARTYSVFTILSLTLPYISHKLSSKNKYVNFIRLIIIAH